MTGAAIAWNRIINLWNHSKYRHNNNFNKIYSLFYLFEVILLLADSYHNNITL